MSSAAISPAVEAALNKAARVLRPPPSLSISEWADRYRQLSPEGSAEPGQWHTARAEYQRGIMDAVKANREVVVMSSTQVGKTEIINNIVGYFIAQDPAPIFVVQPTLEMGELWSKDCLSPMIRDTPALRAVIAESKEKDARNTQMHKSFPGGRINIAGANSAASLAARRIRILLLDEVDRYETLKEGDPVAIARRRTTNFWNRRVVMTSTPTIKGASRVEQAFSFSDQRRYFVPCPHCETFQILRWAQVQWQDDDPDTARIACESCGSLLDDGDRVGMVRDGEWRSTAPFRGVVGFHLWEAYSPWRSLAEIVDSFMKAKPYPETLKTWVNTTLGESWEDRLGERIEADSLAARAEEYAQWHVPEGALLLTAGVDVQHDRLALAVWGWGEGEEAWAIGWQEINGPPMEPKTWEQLTEILERRLPHALGGTLPIERVCVDAGDGATMDYVLDYCRRHKTTLAIKGQSQENKKPLGRPTKVDVSARGKTPAWSALLWPVGSSSIKRWLMDRIKGEGLVHFPADLPDEFYAQLTAERLETKYSFGVAQKRWVKTAGVRNEALDCTVYAYAAAVHRAMKAQNWAQRRVMASGPKESPSEPKKAPGGQVWGFHPTGGHRGRGFIGRW